MRFRAYPAPCPAARREFGFDHTGDREARVRVSSLVLVVDYVSGFQISTSDYKCTS